MSPSFRTLLLTLVAMSASAEDTLVYFGTYTQGDEGSKGIYVSHFDPDTGALDEPVLAAEMANPSFLAIHPERPLLYAVSEVSQFDGSPGGAVVAFAIDRASGQLRRLNAQSTGGGGPCHVTVDPSGNTVLVANYGGGSCASFPLADDGSLEERGSFLQHTGSSIHPQRQQSPHAHSINPSPDGRFAFVADLGTDRIEIYRLDAEEGTLTPHDHALLKPGSGPRHFAIHPSGTVAWVVNELTLTVTGYTYSPENGELEEIQTISTIPEGDRDRPGQSTAEIQADPKGRFLYASNRGHDSIAVFEIAPESGQLTLVEVAEIQGRTPRNFGIDPSGSYLLVAGQNSNSVRVFAIDPETGKLTATDQEIALSKPVCVKFVPPRR